MRWNILPAGRKSFSTFQFLHHDHPQLTCNKTMHRKDLKHVTIIQNQEITIVSVYVKVFFNNYYIIILDDAEKNVKRVKCYPNSCCQLK